MARSLLGDESITSKLAPLSYTEVDVYDLTKELAYEPLWSREIAHGDDDFVAHEARQSVITVMTSLEKWREAERQAEKLVASSKRTHGEHPTDIIHAIERLAGCLKEQGKYSGSESLNHRVFRYIFRSGNPRTPNHHRTSPKPDSKTIEAKKNLSITDLVEKSYWDAATCPEEVFANRERSGLADTDDDMVSIIANVKGIYIAGKPWEDAKEMAEREAAARFQNVTCTETKM
ncbi:MAG: hypothetical protein Q9178_003879 [Gyalolechia marmorata]